MVAIALTRSDCGVAGAWLWDCHLKNPAERLRCYFVSKWLIEVLMDRLKSWLSKLVYWDWEPSVRELRQFY